MTTTTAPTVAPLLLRYEDVSARTGIPVETLRTWRKYGRGPRMFKVGRHVVTTEADLVEWIERLRTGADSA